MTTETSDICCGICCDASQPVVFTCKNPNCESKHICYDCLTTYIISSSYMNPNCPCCSLNIPMIELFKIFNNSDKNKLVLKIVKHVHDRELNNISEVGQISKELNIFRKMKVLRENKDLSKIIKETLQRRNRNFAPEPSNSQDPDVIKQEEYFDLSINSFIQCLDKIKDNTAANVHKRFCYSITYDDKITLSRYNKLVDAITKFIVKLLPPDVDINEILNNIEEILISTTENDVINKAVERLKNKHLGKTVNAQYIFRCGTEGCKGFVDVTTYKCTLCGQQFCDKCHEKINKDSSSTEHVCLESDIQTAKFIKENTRVCPNCSAPIIKVSGCNEVFCNNCHVGFNYTTLKYIKGDFENPDRSEWINNGQISSYEQLNESWRSFNVIIKKKAVLPLINYRYKQMSSIAAEINTMESSNDEENKLLLGLINLSQKIITDIEYYNVVHDYVTKQLKKDMLLNIYKTFISKMCEQIIIINTSLKKLSNDIHDDDVINIINEIYMNPDSDNIIAQLKNIVKENKVINELGEELVDENKISDINKIITEATNGNITSIEPMNELIKAIPLLKLIRKQLNEIEEMTVDVACDIESFADVLNVNRASIRVPMNKFTSDRSVMTNAHFDSIM